ncbi:hypothetical protein PHYPSEUDO_009506 [Phytophthora pseudosyringae]|uniref:Uncharacterized protein n=1 Tax=Phytophthora pseudosyringae TaxID=221518 RepID=A0A8T1VEX0_9STRA|nr:hypothetical protein PHYPSEUDO_009506 [Phytophthora pseudosyringae]
MPAPWPTSLALGPALAHFNAEKQTGRGDPDQRRLTPMCMCCADHRFKCRIRSVNRFGLYANADIELLLRSDRLEPGAPLAAVDAVVVERIDLSADKCSRRLTIRSPDSHKTPTKFDLELRELF